MRTVPIRRALQLDNQNLVEAADPPVSHTLPYLLDHEVGGAGDWRLVSLRLFIRRSLWSSSHPVGCNLTFR